MSVSRNDNLLPQVQVGPGVMTTWKPGHKGGGVSLEAQGTLPPLPGLHGARAAFHPAEPLSFLDFP